MGKGLKLILRKSIRLRCGHIETVNGMLWVKVTNEGRDPEIGLNCGIYVKKRVTWVVSLLDKMHHPPVIRWRILQLGLGKYLVLHSRITKLVILPFTIHVGFE